MAAATTRLKGQVYELADKGVSTTEICKQLPISRWTVWRLLRDRQNKAQTETPAATPAAS